MNTLDTLDKYSRADFMREFAQLLQIYGFIEDAKYIDHAKALQVIDDMRDELQRDAVEDIAIDK